MIRCVPGDGRRMLDLDRVAWLNVAIFQTGIYLALSTARNRPTSAHKDSFRVHNPAEASSDRALVLFV